MTISGTVQLAGRIRYTSPVPSSDWSANPSWLADVLEVMACSGREEGEYTLTADGDTAVSLGSLSAGANLVVVKVMPTVGIPPSPGFPNGVPAAPNPVVVKLTSTAGAAQALVVDGFLFLLSAGTPYTAVTVARSAGVQTVVRVLLFAAGS
jgi:hypothetical protein